MSELWVFYIIEGLVMEVVGTWLIAQPFLKFTKFRFFTSKEIDGVTESMNNFKESAKKVSKLQQGNLNKLDAKLILAHIEELHALLTHNTNMANIGTTSNRRFDEVVINYVIRGMIMIIGGFVLQVTAIVIQAMI